ncbi:MAG: hypothetical protein ACOC5T_03980 [Elusimicrobiota bacterium]
MSLEEVFNVEEEKEEEVCELEATPIETPKVSTKTYPEEIIRINIEKANIILDKIMDEMNRGVFTATLVEAAGNIIGQVTTAASNLIMFPDNDRALQIKEEALKLKEREVVIKEIAAKTGKNNKGNLNIDKAIICTREDIMKQLEK